MAKLATKRRFNRLEAISLHAAANKSDPFAAKRIAMTIARDGYKEQQAIGEDSQRLISSCIISVRKAFLEWKAEQKQTLGDILAAALKPKSDRAMKREAFRKFRQRYWARIAEINAECNSVAA